MLGCLSSDLLEVGILSKAGSFSKSNDGTMLCIPKALFTQERTIA